MRTNPSRLTLTLLLTQTLESREVSCAVHCLAAAAEWAWWFLLAAPLVRVRSRRTRVLIGARSRRSPQRAAGSRPRPCQRSEGVVRVQ